jgi:UTP:GlnB (protein PII) uridylyltransferase
VSFFNFVSNHVVFITNTCHFFEIFHQSNEKDKKMRMLTQALVAGLAFGTCTVASAATTDNGYAEIARGDYVAAEQRITTEQRMFRHDPDLMLNMAYVYARTGRVSQARALYSAVLTMPDEMLDLPQGYSAPSHDVARTALSRLDRVEVTFR